MILRLPYKSETPHTGSNGTVKALYERKFTPFKKIENEIVIFGFYKKITYFDENNNVTGTYQEILK
jgi:hypothetical protein